MKFSLVVATLGRVTELERFLACLDQQTFRDFELIVVDQNPDDRLTPIVAAYVESYPLRHLRAAPGVSRARNLGMRQARGEIIGFPDDDCWYLPCTLERLANAFEEQPEADGLSGPCIDDSGVILRRGPHTSSQLTKYNLFPRTCAVTMFLRRERIASLDGFDETLGPGSGTPWGSAEDHEYVVRALKAGVQITYRPDLGVCHADAPHAFDEHEIRKERAYARGEGRFLKMHQYSKWYFGFRIARALGGAAIGAMRADGAKVRYHLSGVIGKLEGWREICIEVPALPGPIVARSGTPAANSLG
jgi:glycosyltransferase involved in cell wall biosynthesis